MAISTNILRKLVICLSLKDEYSREIAARLSIEKSTVNDIYIKKRLQHPSELDTSAIALKITIRVEIIIGRKAF